MSSKFHVPGDCLVHLLDFNLLITATEKWIDVSFREPQSEKKIILVSTFLFYVYFLFTKLISL